MSQHIPEKNQSEQSFIEEELVPNSLTIVDWIPQAKKLLAGGKFSHLEETISSWSIASKVFENTSEDKPKEDEKPRLKDVSNEDAKKTIEKNLVLEESAIPTPDDVPKIETEEVHIPKTQEFKFNRIRRFTKQEKAYVKFEVVGEPKDQNFMLSYNYPQISSFSDVKSFVIAREKLLDQLTSELSIIMDQDEEEDKDLDGIHHTKWDQVGINLSLNGPILSKIDDVSLFFERMKSMPKDSNFKKIEKRYFSVTCELGEKMEEWANMIFNDLHTLEDSFQRIREVREFVEAFLLVEGTRLKTLPNTYHEKYTIWLDDHIDMNFLHKFAPASYVIRDYIVASFRDLTLERVVEGHVDQNKGFALIQQNIRANLNISATENEVPARIAGTPPLDVFKAVLLANCLPRYTRIDYKKRDISVYSATTLVDCILAHVFLPVTSLTNQTIADINNYIYYHLIRHVDGYRGRHNYSTFDLTADHLMDSLDNIPTTGNAEKRQFAQACHALFIDWAAGNHPELINFPDKFQKFVGRSRRYVLPFGERLYEDSVYSSKMNLLNLFVEKISGNRLFNNTYNTKIRVIINLLNVVIQNISNSSFAMFKLQEILKRISLHPMANPITHAEWLDYYAEDVPKPERILRQRIVLQEGELCSFFMLVNPLDVPIKPVSYKTIKDIHYLAGYLNEIIDRYRYAKTHLHKDSTHYSYIGKMFTRSERMKFSLQTVEFVAPGSIGQDLLNELAKRYGYGLKMDLLAKDKDDTPVKYLTIRDDMWDFIESKSELFGYAHGFFYDPLTDLSQSDKKNLEVYDGTNVSIQLSRHGRNKNYTKNDIVDKIHSSTFHTQLYDEMRSFKRISFDLPINIELVKYNGQVSADTTFPLSVEQRSVMIHTGVLKKYFRMTFEDTYLKFWTPSTLTKPLYFTTGSTLRLFYNEALSTLYNFMKMRTRMTSNVKYVTVDSIIAAMFVDV